MAIYHYTVLKVSAKLAYLITDGSRIAWVQKRARRQDGTFGDGATRALNSSPISGSTIEDYERYNNTPVSVKVKWMPFESDRAWRISATWFPKSLCSLIKNEDKTFTLTGPRWLIIKEFDISA